jgi:hypothetical protein
VGYTLTPAETVSSVYLSAPSLTTVPIPCVHLSSACFVSSVTIQIGGVVPTRPYSYYKPPRQTLPHRIVLPGFQDFPAVPHPRGLADSTSSVSSSL